MSATVTQTVRRESSGAGACAEGACGGGAPSCVRIGSCDERGALLCTSLAPPPGASTLRCRFTGAGDVPAQRCAASGGVTCVPPECGAGGAKALPFAVFADDELLDEGVYDGAAAAAQTDTPPDAVTPAPEAPRSRMSGLKPFVIMCARRVASARLPAPAPERLLTRFACCRAAIGPLRTCSTQPRTAPSGARPRAAATRRRKPSLVR
jgi:hypothetical protein